MVFAKLVQTIYLIIINKFIPISSSWSEKFKTNKVQRIFHSNKKIKKRVFVTLSEWTTMTRWDF